VVDDARGGKAVRGTTCREGRRWWENAVVPARRGSAWNDEDDACGNSAIVVVIVTRRDAIAIIAADMPPTILLSPLLSVSLSLSFSRPVYYTSTCVPFFLVVVIVGPF
jgi:hypothetical protein